MLLSNANITLYRKREENFLKYFSEEESIVYCQDIVGLFNEIKVDSYKPEEWRLFIDSSKRSIKAVLLHIKNDLAPIPIAHFTVLEQNYQNLRKVLEKIKYKDHKWQFFGDLKATSMILGQQSGFIKFPCFLCE